MGCPEIESTDHLEGIAPVPLQVRLDPGRPGKIIAVPFSLTAYSHGKTGQVSTRGTGAGGAFGVGAPARLPVAVGGDQIDRGEVRHDHEDAA